MTRKKSATRKTKKAAKRPAAKKRAAKKPAAKKAAAKKAAKRTTTKSAKARKKTATKKPAAKKSVAKKPTAKKPAAKKKVVKKPAPKKPATKKAAAPSKPAPAKKTGVKAKDKTSVQAKATTKAKQPATKTAGLEKAARPADQRPAKAAGKVVAKAVAVPLQPSAPVAPVAAPEPPKPVVQPEEPKSGKKKLDFKTKQYVVYPAHGVGQIVTVEEQEVAGTKVELFVVEFEKDKMTLRVPTAKAKSVGMRPLASKETVKSALQTLKGRARIKRTMWSRRAQEYEAKINSGDLISIAEVVRDLHRASGQPEQSYSERQLYEAALDRMAREVAAVEKLNDADAIARVETALQKPEAA